EAMAALRRVSEMKPGNAAMFLRRGVLYIEFKMFTQALKDFDDALAWAEQKGDKEGVALARRDRAWTYSQLGAYASAIRDYEAALATGVADPQTPGRFAWLLATCPDEKFRDGKRAFELAWQANEKAAWQAGALYGILAAAYAETDRFDEAVSWAQKAA